MKKLLVLAGEESGVIYARRIADKARELFPDVEVRGYGDYGFDVADLAVFGFWEVLKRIFFFFRVRRVMEKAIDEWRPDAVCTVDYPGMNLRLAAYAKRKGVRAVHVVCPQVWAWRSGRIPKIEASLDGLCCFFPFEPSLFKPSFAQFIGHPLIEEFPQTLNQERDKSLLAILPGSRLGEIERILPVLLDAIEGLDCRPVIPAANEKAKALIDKIVSSRNAKVEVRLGGAREVLHRARCAVAASGTVTLEAALAGCPTILVYKVGPFLAFMAKRLLNIKHVGLANIVWEKCRASAEGNLKDESVWGGFPMLELLQEDFTAESVRNQLKGLLFDDNFSSTIQKRLAEIADFLRLEGDSVTKIVRFLV